MREMGRKGAEKDGDEGGRMGKVKAIVLPSSCR